MEVRLFVTREARAFPEMESRSMQSRNLVFPHPLTPGSSSCQPFHYCLSVSLDGGLPFPAGLSGLWAQDVQRSPSTVASAEAKAGQDIVKEKYRLIQIDNFAVKEGVEFPAGYITKAQQEIEKQLTSAKIFDEIRHSGEQAAQPGRAVMRLSGAIHNYTLGSRAKRYLAGFGPGASEVDLRLVFQDAVSGQVLRTAELRGGAYGRDLWRKRGQDYRGTCKTGRDAN